MSYQPKLGLIRAKRSLILIHCDCVMWCYTQSLNHCSKQRHAQQILSPQMTHHSETNRSALWEARMQLCLEHFPSTFRLLRKFDIRNGGNPNVHRMLSSLEPGWADLLVRWYEGKGYVNAHEVVMEGICSIAQRIEPSGGVKRSHGRSDQYQMQWRTKHRFGKSNSNLICIRILFGLCIRPCTHGLEHLEPKQNPQTAHRHSPYYHHRCRTSSISLILCRGQFSELPDLTALLTTLFPTLSV